MRTQLRLLPSPWCGCLLLLLLLTGLAQAQTPPPAAPAANATVEDTPPVADTWALIWQSRQKELAVVLEDVDKVRQDLPTLAKRINAAIDGAQREYQRLLPLYQLSKGLPAELGAIAEYMGLQVKALDRELAPVRQQVDGLQARLDEFTGLEKELSQQNADKGSDVGADMAAYVTNLGQAKKKISALRSRLVALLDPGNLLQEKMAATRKQIEERLPDLWQIHYLQPAANLFDPGLWRSMPQGLDVLWQTLPVRLASELPATWSDWTNVGLRFLFVLVPLLFGARMLARYVQRSGGAMASHWQEITQRCLVWLGLGLALHFASWGTRNDIYRAIAVVANLFLIWGQLTLAWQLRILGRETKELPLHPPLRPLLLPVLVGLLLLFLNPPLALLGPAWVLLLGVAIVLRRRRQPHGPLLLLETNVLFLEPICQWLSLLLTVLGWGRLAILFYMVYVAVAVTLQLGLGLMRLVNEAAQRLPKEGPSALFKGVILALAAPVILILAAVALVLWVVAYPGGAYLLRKAFETNFSIGTVSFDFLRILLILSAFYITRTAISVGNGFLRQLPARGFRLDASVIPSIQTILTYALWVLFGFYVLNALGMSLTSLAVVAGGLSVGIGFGLQTIFNNFISGLILIFGRSLQEGDIIEVGGTMGTVRKISIRATMVETFDSAIIFVPNSELISNRLTNWTRNTRTVRQDVNVGVAYGSDVPLVTRLLLEVASAHPRVLRLPKPAVLFSAFGASSLDFILRVWIDDISNTVSALSELRIAIEQAFREHQVEIAFPQMDLHIRTADGMSLCAAQVPGAKVSLDSAQESDHEDESQAG